MVNVQDEYASWVYTYDSKPITHRLKSNLVTLKYTIIIIKRESYQPINYFHDFFVFQVFYLFNLLDDAAGKNERAVSCRKTFEYSKVKTSEYDREYIYAKIETT